MRKIFSDFGLDCSLKAFKSRKCSAAHRFLFVNQLFPHILFGDGRICEENRPNRRKSSHFIRRRPNLWGNRPNLRFLTGDGREMTENSPGRSKIGRNRRFDSTRSAEIAENRRLDPKNRRIRRRVAQSRRSDPIRSKKSPDAIEKIGPGRKLSPDSVSPEKFSPEQAEKFSADSVSPQKLSNSPQSRQNLFSSRIKI